MAYQQSILYTGHRIFIQRIDRLTYFIYFTYLRRATHKSSIPKGREKTVVSYGTKKKKIDEKTYFDLLRLETRNGIICSTVPFLSAGHICSNLLQTLQYSPRASHAHYMYVYVYVLLYRLFFRLIANSSVLVRW